MPPRGDLRRGLRRRLAGLARLGVAPGEPDPDGKRRLTYDEGGQRVLLEIDRVSGEPSSPIAPELLAMARAHSVASEEMAGGR